MYERVYMHMLDRPPDPPGTSEAKEYLYNRGYNSPQAVRSHILHAKDPTTNQDVCQPACRQRMYDVVFKEMLCEGLGEEDRQKIEDSGNGKDENWVRNTYVKNLPRYRAMQSPCPTPTL